MEKTVRIDAGSISKVYTFNDKMNCEKAELINHKTNETFLLSEYEEFILSYGKKQHKHIKYQTVKSSDCELVTLDEGKLRFVYRAVDKSGNEFTFTQRFKAGDGYIRQYLTVDGSNRDLFIDSITFSSFAVPSNMPHWSIPTDVPKTHIEPYITTLGQPVYCGSFFFGAEFPAADNRIKDGRVSLRYNYGRKLSELVKEGNGTFTSCDTVSGAALGSSMKQWRDGFFKYLDNFKRPETFRLQFNSWYDNMLDITTDNIKESFLAVHEGLKKYGVRDLDSYVVDDGWIDYDNPEFWAFRKQDFPNEFNNEKALMESMNSGFGVWFGPRGGYTQAGSYAKLLNKKYGYGVNNKVREICTGDPRYVEALCDRMCQFIRDYNVNYFKIDGFALGSCTSKNHGHPTGGYKNIYFFTYEWEIWCKAFKKMRAEREDVFLNMTSHSHCSPWFLKWVDSVWMNNASDMAYVGKGTDLDQCLNYRDGRYYDLQKFRQLQFPAGHFYNHEPCYAERNFNPPLPSPKHRTVIYTNEEFRKYLYMCMMRGTGFIEMYYSPSLFDDDKWRINAEILKWAEDNFSVLHHSEYFGGIPEKGSVYGYMAYTDEKGYMIIRNPASKPQKYNFDMKPYSGGSERTFTPIFCDEHTVTPRKARNVTDSLTLELAPYETVLFEIAQNGTLLEETVIESD